MNCSFAQGPYGLDPTFGINGSVSTSSGVWIARGARSVLLQPDGKIIAGGDGNSQFAIIRYDSTGAIDSTFGVNGLSTTPIAGSGSDIWRMLLQPDGKILATGDIYGNLGVVRFLSNGSLDTSFGTGGIAKTSLGPAWEQYTYGIALQGTKVVIAGYYSASSADIKIILVRYTEYGLRDSTFGVNGIVETRIGAISQAVDIAVLPNNKIVVAGNAVDGGINKFVVLRYLSDGVIDSTYGTNGYTLTAINNKFSTATRLKLLSSGNLLVAGTCDSSFAAVCYLPNGALDPAFGTGGIALSQPAPSKNVAYAIAELPGGKILLAGKGIYNSGNFVRYHPNGTLDSSFAINGMLHHYFGYSPDGFWDMALQPDGKFIGVGAQSGTPTPFKFLIKRYTGIFPTTEVNSQYPPSQIDLFPNPVTGDGIVRIVGMDQAHATFISVYNSHGELVSTTAKSDGFMDFSSLSDGLYFVRIVSTHRIKVIRLIKSN